MKVKTKQKKKSRNLKSKISDNHMHLGLLT